MSQAVQKLALTATIAVHLSVMSSDVYCERNLGIIQLTHGLNSIQ